MSGILPKEIVLADGTTAVPLADVPSLVAKALHPPVWCTQAIGRIEKLNRDCKAVPLNSDEDALLNRAWSGLPSAIGATDWMPYQIAFDALDDKPDWRPTPVWANPQWEAAEKRDAMRVEIENALDHDIENGVLKVDNVDGERVIQVSELQRYVDQRAITVRFSWMGDRVPTAMERAAETVGYCDYSMSARHWFGMPDVPPKEAAMVLCRLNPLKETDTDTYVDAIARSFRISMPALYSSKESWTSQ